MRFLRQFLAICMTSSLIKMELRLFDMLYINWLLVLKFYSFKQKSLRKFIDSFPSINFLIMLSTLYSLSFPFC